MSSNSSLQKSIIITIFNILISLSSLNVSKAIELIPNLDLGSTSLDPTKTGFTIAPSTLGAENFGQSLDSAGDINGDGYDDIIIGAYGYNSDKGAVYVIYGGPSSVLKNIDTSSLALDPATTGFIITGQTAGDRFGERVSRAGDINNDGYDDIIIGVHEKNNAKGAVYVIYGGPKSSFSNIDLSSTTLDPATTGFVITGENNDDHFGFSVNTAGDINKDGYNDIIVGAHARNNFQGAAYVIYGGPKSSLLNLDLSSTALNPISTGFTLKGNSLGDMFGRWVNTAGDINSDGYDDLIIGAPQYYNSAKGVVYVIYGKEKSLLPNIDFSLTTLDPATTGFIIKGKNTNDQLGISVSTAGDINGDGYDDMIIGAYGYNGNIGAAYAIYGGPKSSLSNIDLSSTTLSPTTTGFMIIGSSSSVLLGWPVTSGGDIDGDGFHDIIIGAGAWGLNGKRGSVYVIYGGPKSSLSNIDLSLTTLDPATRGFTLTGKAVNDQFGFSVNVGDINNDGFSDIIIGAPLSGGSGIAYVIHNACRVAHCNSCVSRECQICDQGYGLSNSLCEVCPSNCYQCTLSSICEQCTSPSLLYQSWCLPSCPIRTFSSNGKCQDCPLFCSSCTSQESCQTCDQGYTLSNSQCISRDSHLKTEIAATQAVSSGFRGISSVVNIGSATSPMTALVSKVVQNTRYLNLSVTDELNSIYQTWQTDLISWQVPNAVSNPDHYKTSPELFAQYGLSSSFLENFWATLMTIALSIAILIIFLGLKVLLDEGKYDNWFTSLVKKLIAGSFNFALVQAYGCFDDILFYLILDIKTNPFDTFFSWISLICAFGFLALGCFLIFFNIWKVKQYQGIKNNPTDVAAFTERNKKWELFYSDFNDSDLWSQSTLGLLVVRSSLSSLIITTVYEYPLMQAAFLVILDGVIILFLYFKDPFATLRGKLAQYYFEAITLFVHLCTFILAMQDTFPSSSEILRNILSTSIIYLNTALVSGSVTFLGIEIYKTISQKKREAKRKQLENITVREETQDTQRILPHTQPTNRIHPEPEKSILRNNKRENSLPGFTQNIHVSFSDMNLQPSNDYNLSMNTEDSILPDMDSSLRNNNALRPQIRHHFQPRRIQQQRRRSLETNHKRQIRNLAHIDPID